MYLEKWFLFIKTLDLYDKTIHYSIVLFNAYNIQIETESTFKRISLWKMYIHDIFFLDVSGAVGPEEYCNGGFKSPSPLIVEDPSQTFNFTQIPINQSQFAGKIYKYLYNKDFMCISISI